MSSDLPTLYYFPSSFYSQKALLALTEKGIPVNKHLVNLGVYENYSEWFMKLNPKGQVPVLVDEGKIISDSSAIIKYADETYEGPVLMPELGKEKWSNYQNMFEDIKIEVLTFGAILYPDCVKNSLIPEMFQVKTRATVKSGKRTKQLQEMMEKNPDMTEIYQRKLSECNHIESLPDNKQLLLTEIEKVKKVLTTVEEGISERKYEWLCGPDITVADVCLAVLLHRLKLTGHSTDLWENNQLPLVAAYYEKLLYRKTFRDVCVQGSSKKHALKYMVDWIPTIGGCLVLAMAVTYTYIMYS